MAFSGKYGDVSIPKLAKDEPVFILRGQDKLALTAIEMYKSLAASHECFSVVGTLDMELERFRKWKGPKKLPD